MTLTRRHFLATSAAITVLPYAANAEAHSMHTFDTASGQITMHPVEHASIVFETPAGVIYVDPVGDAEAYADFPAPNLVIITHEHGDHFDPDTLAAVAPDAPMITNPAVFDMLPDDMQNRAMAMANGDITTMLGIDITAIPAYNTTEDRLDFHPQGRDNGYVMTIDGFRVYVSGDTEDIPEMRSLENIDLAFVSMNLPFTMDKDAAASAVNEFAPRYVYPYHYRGRDGGTQDPEEFVALLNDGIEGRTAGWYGDDVMPEG
ncbi:MAG: MBL fold metallo-hydrolase [Loktanella sp.]|nr:MBL fold metallo-hydrolase [Loktanella sp.]